MDTTIESLGEPRIDSPLKRVEWVDDNEQVLFDLSPHKLVRDVREGRTPVSFMKAGPRQKIFFDQQIEVCDGHLWRALPGLNDVIRSLVLTLYHIYGVRHCSASVRTTGFIRVTDTLSWNSPDVVADIGEDLGLFFRLREDLNHRRDCRCS
jgi:6-phosphofructokinase 1